MLRKLAKVISKYAQDTPQTIVQETTPAPVIIQPAPQPQELPEDDSGNVNKQAVRWLDLIPTPVVAMDRNFTITYINQAGAGIVNSSPNSCKGKKCYDLFRTKHCNSDNCGLSIAMRKDSTITSETIAQLPKGDVPIRYTGVSVRNKEGNVVGGLEYILDISEEINALNGILEIVNEATEGNLSSRSDESQYDGNYQKILKGINDLLDIVSEPINETSDVLTRLAENDLTVRVKGNYRGDLSKIKLAVNTVIDSLSALVSQIRTNADSLAAASEQLSKVADQAGQATQQIASTSQQVAKGAAEQSAALQQSSEGIDQLSKAIIQISLGAQEQAIGVERNVEIVNQVSSAVLQVSENAQVAAQGSHKASDAAEKGADMTIRTVEGMEKIRDTMGIASSTVQSLGEQSNEIGKIVATIDDIAAQTNLLALNAAIEAARAGEQGRGFAVVADEVRKLAERSSGATKEIADLISNIQKGVDEAVKAMEDGNHEVDSGYKLATDAGESLSDILNTVKEVSLEVERISAASEELNALSTEMVKITDGVSGIVEENTAATEEMGASADDITKSIESVAGVAEENSAATQQVSASAEEMSAQVEEVVASAQTLAEMSEELQRNISVFKLN
ncbi:MAG: PAS domain-containing protein [Dehalococcoidales bacterium]|nr:PAS domain-containing protein [Dehalococcoidales bacterium]